MQLYKLATCTVVIFMCMFLTWMYHIDIGDSRILALIHLLIQVVFLMFVFPLEFFYENRNSLLKRAAAVIGLSTIALIISLLKDTIVPWYDITIVLVVWFALIEIERNVFPDRYNKT